MPCIDFSTRAWATVNPSMPICSNQGGNTYTDLVTDPTTSISFIIGNGRAYVEPASGGKWLFFSTYDCGQHGHPIVTLVIRFSRAQERVTFRLSFDEHGTVPAVVDFYRQSSNPQQRTNLVRSQTIASAIQPVDIVYDDCCHPIVDITIRTDRPENTVDDLCWGPSHQRQTITLGGQKISFCLCVVERIRRAVGELFRPAAARHPG